MITLGFYKGREGSFIHRMIGRVTRLATRGQYSHVEMFIGPVTYDSFAIGYSSSALDGGVRWKNIFVKKGNWDLVEVDASADLAVKFFSRHLQKKYDYAGILLSHVFALNRHTKNRWFCSEICAAALGIARPQAISPQLLYDVFTRNQRNLAK